MRTIEALLVPSVPLAPDTYLNCRDHYARQRGCIDPRNGKVGGRHLGHDQWASEGTPILAPCDGTMRYISTAGDYGNYGKFQSSKTKKGLWIAHCRDRLRLGDFSKGQEIGKVGTTGTQSTGPHCHSELHPIWDDFNSVENIYPELKAALEGGYGVGVEQDVTHIKAVVDEMRKNLLIDPNLGQLVVEVHRVIAPQAQKLGSALDKILAGGASGGGLTSDERKALLELRAVFK